ncbi:MAG: HYR domain-containing protein, partial [Actinomycetota bacterium]|nr:HYR domain-containing protein [Actinomycetota bacterium]
MFQSRTVARLVAAVGVVTVVVTTTGAYADNLVADGDGVAPVAASGLAFGSSVCSGTEVTKPVALAVSRNGNVGGNNNVFKNGATVTLSVVSSPTGVSLTLPPANSITLPANWQTLDNNTMSSTVIATARLAPGAARTITGEFTLAATGINTNNTVATRETTLKVSGTVSNCTPTDTAAPVLSLPANITSEATSADGAMVTYSATATDANPANPVVTCVSSPTAGLASGSTFPLGTTTLSCSATDAAGNKATGSFTVTVGDTTAPVLTDVPSNVTVEATSATGATVTWIAPTASDAVSTPTISCLTPTDLTSGSTFPLGTSTVTCTATDAVGNADTDAFLVTVADTTGPVIGEITAPAVTEATSGNGAVVTYTAPAASDAVDGKVAVSCEPASGSTFVLGETTVACTATDAAGNTSVANFTVVVHDTTAPVLVVPGHTTEEATSVDGAQINYDATAHDTVDGVVAVICVPPSGATFALGSTRVDCSASDAATNTVSNWFSVTVVDTTAPVLSEMSDLTREATSSSGAIVSFTVPTATDAVGAGPVSCVASGSLLASGSTFPLGTTPVTCSSSDAAGNIGTESFTVTVEDTTAPELAPTEDIVAEATSALGALVTYTDPAASDAVDTTPRVQCTPASGCTFALATTTVICTATDFAGNSSDSHFNITVRDTTGPALTLPADQLLTATSTSGATATYTATATDLVDGAVTVVCTPASGGTFAIGTTTVNCTAADAAGNPSSGSFTVKVQRTMTGFYQPVDTARTLNSVKGGSTLPLKFEVFAGPTELTSVDILAPISIKNIACPLGAEMDEIELLTSGSTAVRYDTSG